MFEEHDRLQSEFQNYLLRTGGLTQKAEMPASRLYSVFLVQVRSTGPEQASDGGDEGGEIRVMWGSGWRQETFRK